MPPWFNPKFCREVIQIAKITTIAQASACVAKMRAGKACSAAEMKATALLLDGALKTARRSTRMAKDQLAKSEAMVRALLARIGV